MRRKPVLRRLLAALPLLLLLGASCTLGAAKLLPIKEIQEPRNFPPAGYLLQNPSGPVKRVQARPAICPGHLVRSLRGRCYGTVAGHHEYRLCPFDNATQRDVSFQMLAVFHGLIGVWDGWHVENGSFAAMAMPNGDPCPPASGASGGYRRTLVRLGCANATGLLAVVESPVCQYNMLLGTPLACHPHSMLVYPCLLLLTDPAYSRGWDAIHTMRDRGIVNESGYNLLLDNLLFRAQLLTDTRAHVGSRPVAQGAPAPLLVGAADRQPIRSESQQPREHSVDFVSKQILSLQKQIQLSQQAAANLPP